MTPSHDLTSLVHCWLDRLQALDLEALVDMYDPHAVMQAMSETWNGRQEIEDGLSFARRWIRGIEVDDVRPMVADGQTMTFETMVRGKLGRALVRHTWTLDGGRIQGHMLHLVRHDKVAA